MEPITSDISADVTTAAAVAGMLYLLPDEILEQIFWFVDDSILHTCRATNCRFRRLSQSVLYNRTLVNLPIKLEDLGGKNNAKLELKIGWSHFASSRFGLVNQTLLQARRLLQLSELHPHDIPFSEIEARRQLYAGNGRYFVDSIDRDIWRHLFLNLNVEWNSMPCTAAQIQTFALRLINQQTGGGGATVAGKPLVLNRRQEQQVRNMARSTCNLLMTENFVNQQHQHVMTTMMHSVSSDCILRDLDCGDGVCSVHQNNVRALALELANGQRFELVYKRASDGLLMHM